MSVDNKKEYTRSGRQVTLIDRVFDKMVRGVVVITTRLGAKLNGMTACWVSRSADQPFLVLASIWRKNYSHDLIKESKMFAINILRSDQVDLARHFGKQSGREMNKFSQVPYMTGKTGSPLISNCLAYLDCWVVNSTESGDHTIFGGEGEAQNQVRGRATLR